MEKDKFTTNDDGERVVRTTAKGEFTPSGLKTAGLITIVEVNNSTWTALPASALTARNAIAIQNRSGESIKINYDNSVVGYVGIEISDGGERFYDITDAIIIYAKSSASTINIVVEELS